MTLTAFVTALLLASTPTVDIHVEGQGLLRFIRDGRAVYAKAASLTVADGKLVDANGIPTLPAINISGSYDQIAIGEDGTITLKTGEATRIAGRLNIAIFADEAGLSKDGAFLISPDRPKLVLAGSEYGRILTKGVEAAAPAKPVEGPKPPTTVPTGNSTGIADDTIQVHDFTEIDTDEYTLGMIADVNAPTELKAQLEAIVLGTTSAVGVKRQVPSSVIQAKLRTEGIDPTKFNIVVSKTAAVARKGQTIDGEAILQAVTESIRRQLGEATEIALDQPVEPMVVPTGKLTLAVDKPFFSGTRCSATIIAYVDAKRCDTRVVRLRAVSPLLDIKIGSAIKIRVKAGTASVETSGKVKSVNMTAQTVNVEIETGAILTGKLAKDGVIEVAL
jgi:hypothetical protein